MDKRTLLNIISALIILSSTSISNNLVIETALQRANVPDLSSIIEILESNNNALRQLTKNLQLMRSATERQ